MSNCEAEGAVGVMAFPDPDMYGRGGEIPPPDTWWLRYDSIIRDSARDTYGDPGSFFYPSLGGKLQATESYKAVQKC